MILAGHAPSRGLPPRENSASAAKGHHQAQHQVLKRTGDPIADAEAASSSFLRAAELGEVNVLERWLESRDRRRLMTVVDEQQRGAAHLAARAGHGEVLRLLHSHGTPMETKDRFGRTPLHLSCEFGRQEALEALLDCGAQPGREDKHGRTALHLAACSDNAALCEHLLLRLPQLIECCDCHARTPLFYAALNVNPPARSKATRMLLAQQADVNVKDSYGRTPLHYAAQESRKDSVQLLLSAGADPQAADAVGGCTPQELAVSESVRNEFRRVPALPGGGAGGAAGADPTAAVQGQTAGMGIGRRSGGPGAQQMPSRSASPPRHHHSPVVATTPGGRPLGGGYANSAPLTLPRVPGALGAPFQALQARFVQIMERVQEGGLQQMEHVKRPHLFTASWMIDVASHQQLLGQTLKYVPGPEVCMRVFNLLRPPRGFPQSCGDERDIISYYSDQAAKNWGGIDPYSTSLAGSQDEGLTHAGRVELLRAVHDQKRELEEKEVQLEETKHRADRLEAELQKGLTADEAKALRERLSRCKEESASRGEELDSTLAKVRNLEGQIRVLSEELRQEKERNSELASQESEVRRKLEQELMQKGAEKSWQVVVEEERKQSHLLRRQLEQQVRETQDAGQAALKKAATLEAENKKLQQDLHNTSQQAIKASDAHEMVAAEMRADVLQLRTQLEDARSKIAEFGRTLATATAQAEQATNRSRELQTTIEAHDREAEAKRLRLEAEIATCRSDEARLQERLEASKREITSLYEQLKAAEEMGRRYLAQKVPMVVQMMNPEATPASALQGAPISSTDVPATSPAGPSSSTIVPSEMPPMAPAPPPSPPTTSTSAKAVPKAQVPPSFAVTLKGLPEPSARDPSSAELSPPEEEASAPQAQAEATEAAAAEEKSQDQPQLTRMPTLPSAPPEVSVPEGAPQTGAAAPDIEAGAPAEPGAAAEVPAVPPAEAPAPAPPATPAPAAASSDPQDTGETAAKEQEAIDSSSAAPELIKSTEKQRDAFRGAAAAAAAQRSSSKDQAAAPAADPTPVDRDAQEPPSDDKATPSHSEGLELIKSTDKQQDAFRAAAQRSESKDTKDEVDTPVVQTSATPKASAEAPSPVEAAPTDVPDLIKSTEKQKDAFGAAAAAAAAAAAESQAEVADAPAVPAEAPTELEEFKGTSSAIPEMIEAAGKDEDAYGDTFGIGTATAAAVAAVAADEGSEAKDQAPEDAQERPEAQSADVPDLVKSTEKQRDAFRAAAAAGRSEDDKVEAPEGSATEEAVAAAAAAAEAPAPATAAPATENSLATPSVASEAKAEVAAPPAEPTKEAEKQQEAADEKEKLLMLKVSVKRANNLINRDTLLPGDLSDPLCSVAVRKAKDNEKVDASADKHLYSTKTLQNTLDPVWDDAERDVSCSEADSLVFSVWDKDLGSKELLGRALLPASKALENAFEGDLELVLPAGKTSKGPPSTLNVAMKRA